MKSLRIFLSVAIGVTFLVASPTTDGGSFKLRKIGEHKLLSGYSQCMVNGKIAFELSSKGEYQNSTLSATDLVSNKRIWERSFKNSQCTYMVAYQNKLFLDNLNIHIDSPIPKYSTIEQSCNVMYCIDQKNGRETWELESSSYQTPIFIGNKTYHSVGSYKCTAIPDRKQIWMYKATKPDYGFCNCIVRNYTEDAKNNDMFVQDKNNTLKRLGDGNDKYVFFSGIWHLRPWTTRIADLFCACAQTGKIIWKLKLSDKPESFDGTNSPVDIEGCYFIRYISDKDNVYILKFDGSLEPQKRIRVFSIQISTGKKLWDVGLSQNNDYIKFYIDHGKDYIIINKWIIDKKTGKLIRTLSTQDTVIQSKQQDSLFIVNQKNVESIKARTGKRNWLSNIGVGSSYTEILERTLEQDNKLFILTERGLTCIDAQNGKTLDSWNYKVTPKSVFSAGKNLVACEIVNSEGNPTILLFEY